MKTVFLFLSFFFFFSSCEGTFGLFPEEENPQGSIYFNEKKREMIKSDKYYLPGLHIIMRQMVLLWSYCGMLMVGCQSQIGLGITSAD
jgi:hypothetical protein